MNPETFALQHSDIPQGRLVDEDPVTANWPLPPARAWQPSAPSLWAQACALVGAVIEAIDEPLFGEFGDE